MNECARERSVPLVSDAGGTFDLFFTVPIMIHAKLKSAAQETLPFLNSICKWVAHCLEESVHA